MNSKMSKSQRRKQRLIERGISLAEGANATKGTVPRSQAVSGSFVAANRPVSTGMRATRRRRARRRTSGGRSVTSPLNGRLSYLDALINPELAAGVKVPDEIGYPTGTFQLEARGNLATQTGGDTVAVVCVPFFSSDPASTFFPISTGSAVSVGNLINWTDSTFVQRSAIAALYSAWRPVSAVLEVSYIGGTQNDAGQITAGCTFVRGANNLAKYKGSTFNNMCLLPDMETWPSKMGARVVWKPLDNSNFEFSDYSSATNNTDPLNKLPALVVAITGVPYTGNQYMYELVVNFEGVPGTDSAALVETGPSPTDLGMLKKAFEWAQMAGNNVRPLIGVLGQALEYGEQAYTMFQRGVNFSSSQGRLTGRPRYRQSSPMALLNVSKTDSDDHGKEEEDELAKEIDALSINPTAPPLQELPQRSVVQAPARVGGYSSQGTSSPYSVRKS